MFEHVLSRHHKEMAGARQQKGENKVQRKGREKEEETRRREYMHIYPTCMDVSS
jgi:hypothetical protein